MCIANDTVQAHDVGNIGDTHQRLRETPILTVKPYADHLPKPCTFAEHFSSILFSGSLPMTLLEISILCGITFTASLGPSVNTANSMPLFEVATYLWVASVVRRLYNTYCEAVFFSFPQYRTQGIQEHALASSAKDLCGRDHEQLKTIEFHDLLTMLSQFGLEIAIYYSIPGYFPPVQKTYAPWYQRFGMLVLNHYVMSFAMYWMHRALHSVPFLWEHIHSLHHYARHPLSRNTYQDHWLDNLGNAIVGHACAQILVPLDHDLFWFSHIFRILESLEKHSGVSCHFNIVHTMQQWLPYAQMPHHHDWHHEGHKGNNFTFTSIGGVWDCIFGTRKHGRSTQPQCASAKTNHDQRMANRPKQSTRSIMDHPAICISPVIAVVGAAMAKLSLAGGTIIAQ